MKSMSVVLLVVLLGSVLLGACAPSTAGPEEETPVPTSTPVPAPTDPPTEESEPVPVSDPSAARDAALNFLREQQGEAAPAADLNWQEENLTPEGLVGGTNFQYTAGDWVIMVDFPVVLPEMTIYDVVVSNTSTGFEWQGQIDAFGELTPAAADEPVTHSDEPRSPSDATPDELAELAAGNNAFALELFQALRSRDGNLFFSPYSISAALAMTYAGARGETEQQMADILHFTLTQDRLHPAFNALDTGLMAADGEDAFQLNVANAIWGQQGFQFLPEFLDTLAQNYGAGLRPVDFVGDTEGARQTINNWVSDETEEKIQDLIPPGALNQATRLVLSNAIYFNGKWVLPFDPNQTQDRPFYLLDGGQVEVPMMSETEDYRYTSGDGYQAIELRYRDSEMTMLLILPELDRYEEIEGAFSVEMLDTILENLSNRQVQLSLPKFTFESQFSLEQVLSEMGMMDAFGGAADFSGMTGGRDLFISKVLHKAFVAVDEEGTEAAAATAVVMELTAVMPDEEPAIMTLDHPFLFLIRDNGTGTTLFAGRVLKPNK